MFVKAARLEDVASGGIISMKVEGQEIALCNVDGVIFAVSRRCGHENAPLNFGTLNGHIITCPLHYAQFDVRNGKALFGPCPRDYGIKKGVKDAASSELENKNREVVETLDLHTFPVKVEAGDIFVDPDYRSVSSPMPG